MGIRESRYPVLPIGLLQIAAVARTWHEVRVLDPNLYPVDDVQILLDQTLETFHPDVVGLSIRNIDTTNFRNQHVHYKTVRPMLERIKKTSPNSRIVVGGPGFSLFARAIMEDIPFIDVGVYLEGEESFPELLKNLSSPEQVKGLYVRNKDRVVYTGDRLMPDFSKVPWPAMDADIIDLENYIGPSYNIIGVQSKRGCVMECGYCAYPALNGRRLRLRDPKDVVDQIEFLVKNMGVKRFAFVDSVFNIPEQHAREILQGMIRRQIHVEFGIWCHMLGITVDFLELLKAAGAVQVDFSPDAATDKGLMALKKGITVEDMLQTVRACRKVKGMGYGFGFFAGLPGYTLGDTLKTWWMPFRIQTMLPGRGGGTISHLRIEPNTLLQQIAIQDGLIDPGDPLLPHNECELSEMFYRLPSHRRLNYATDAVIALMERILKPSLVKMARLVSMTRGKRSVYDQKIGFVDFQKRKKT